MTKVTLQADIEKLQKAIDSKATPDTLKDKLKNKKAELQAEIHKIEASEKAEKEKLQVQEKEVKSIDAILAKATSMVEKKQLINKKSKAKAKVQATKKEIKKVVSVKAPKAKSAIDSAKALLASLPKEVRAFNKGRSASELENDGRVKALKAGKRVSASGNVYYENRPNRSDVSRKKRPYLEDGGVIEVLILTFKDQKNFEYAKEHFEGVSSFYPYQINDEFRSFYFSVQDQYDADSTEKSIDEELKEVEIDNYYFESEGGNEYKTGGKLSNKGAYQNDPESGKKYTRYEDSKDHHRAKPAGWRYTDAGAKRLKLKKANTYVTKEHIEKYRGKYFTDSKGVKHRYVYIERRADKSDIKRGFPYLEKGGYPVFNERMQPLESGIVVNTRDTEDEAKKYIEDKPDLYYEKVGNEYFIKKYAKGGEIESEEQSFHKGDKIKKKSTGEKATIVKLNTSGNQLMESYVVETEEGKHLYWWASDIEVCYECGGRMMERGGYIKNQYQGKTAEQVWNEWTIAQRSHFLLDHVGRLKVEAYRDKDYKDIPDSIELELEFHVTEGQYEKGGSVSEHYNTGRSWHQDRARHNKGEDWEKPLSERKMGDGGKINNGEHESVGEGDILKMEEGEVLAEIAADSLDTQEIEVFGYQTKNFDMSESAVVAFQKAENEIDELDILGGQKQDKKEALKACAEKLDNILGLAKVYEDSDFLMSKEAFEGCILDLQLFSIYCFKAGMFSDIMELATPHIYEMVEGKKEMYAKGGNLKQVLYVDYAGGKFESWFFSDGRKYSGKSSYDYDDILQFKRKNDFTDIVLTDEAKARNRQHEHGGNIEDDNKEMVNIKAKEIQHHVTELKEALVSKNEVPAWVVAKIERASTDLSDVTHFLEGSEFEKGGKVGKNKFDVNDIVSYEGGDMVKEKWVGVVTKVVDLGNEFAYRVDAYSDTNPPMFDASKHNEVYEPQLKRATESKFEVFRKAYVESKKEDGGEMEWGGRTTFKEKIDAVAGSLEGAKVKPKYQKTYGKTYDKKEAMEAAKKIIGSQKAKFEKK